MMKSFHPLPSMQQLYGFILVFLYTISSYQIEAQEYQWETGSWGECTGNICGVNGGRQRRTVTCVNTEDRSTSAFSSCDRSSQPQDVQRCFKLCAEHSSLFKWIIDEWGECEPTASQATASPMQNLKCDASSLGLMLRNVKCVEKATNYIQRPEEDFVDPSVCEMFWEEPPAVKQCFLPCSQDCIVTEFSEWSECSQTCGNATQTRTRRVVLSPNEDGELCPQLSETRTCENLPICINETYEYFLKLGPWSECRRTRYIGSDANTQISFQPSVGEKVRDIGCIRNDGVEVDLSWCLKDPSDILPNTVQPCLISRDCYLSDWSEWSPCPDRCSESSQENAVSRRTRSIIAVPQGNGQRCEELFQEKACSQQGFTPVCQRETYEWYASSWSECLPPGNRSERGCGEDNRRKTRGVFCIRANDTSLRPVDNSLCNQDEMPDVHEVCFVPCAVECQVSSWTSWGSCGAAECETRGVRRGKGYLTRTRSVILEPKNGAEECPHLHEFTPCSVSSCYEWYVSPAGTCRPTDSLMGCGPGKITQQIMCLNHAGKMVNSSYCLELDAMPSWETDCFLPCHQDCVVSEWSDWSECSMTCSGKFKQGMQMRRKIILAQNGEGGRACPPMEEMIDTRKCNDHSCAIFAWHPEPWGRCQLDRGRACGTGRQTRNIVCDRVFPRKDAPLQRCDPKMKPPESQSCEIDCPSDCRMSTYSDWSTCPDTCPVGDGLDDQKRKRYILQHPSHGGDRCPVGMMEERVCPLREECYTYSWLPQAWSECMLASPHVQPRCGDGLKVRAIGCRRSDGRLVDLNYCFSHSDPIPPSSMSCRVPCEDDCRFTSWGSWSSCQADCNGQQFRTRKITAGSLDAISCTNSKVYPLREIRPCECPTTYRLTGVGDWSDCLVDIPSKQEHWCGRGKRFRAVQCLDHNHKVVDVENCQHADSGMQRGSNFLEEPCEVLCPCDCEMSPWSSWDECDIPQGSFTGLQKRRRQLVEPLFGGRPCPQDTLQEVQSRPCEPFEPIETYQWAAQMWEECTVTGEDGVDQTCGQGQQWRNVSCQKRDKAGFFSYVNDSLCFDFEEVVSYKPCYKPCPGQLVYSHWSHWSKCPQNCSGEFYRSRSREIQRPAGDSSVRPNPEPSHLRESQPCQLGVNCFRYYWNATQWSTCVIYGFGECGQGHRFRLHECRSSAGTAVDNALCEEFATNENPSLYEDCTIECPLDCHMSDWSDWSHCSETCGSNAVQTRHRQILQHPNMKGCPCPTNLEQRRPCKAVPCYGWHYGTWTSCSPHEGNCGMGIKKRNVTCHQENGALVSSQLCHLYGDSLYHSNINITVRGYEQLQEEEVCEISCPGECERTDWTPWSVCHLRCIKGAPFGTHGFQIKSRASLSRDMEDCPQDEWIQRQCKGELCLDYVWSVGDWESGKRDVWCQRTDGVKVTGGCPVTSKPHSIAVCNPSCKADQSICSADNKCTCASGFKPRYSRDSGELVECIDASYESIVKPDDSEFQGINPTVYPKKTKKPDPAGVANPLEDLMPIIIGGGAGAVVILVLLIICAFCCCNKKTQAKNDDKLPPPQYRDYSNRFWDDNAKMKYTGEIEL